MPEPIEAAAGEARRYQLRPRRRTRWMWWVRRLFVVTAAVVMYRSWGDRAQHRLDVEELALAAAGEPTSAAWLAPAGLPDADNAAVDLRAAAAVVRGAAGGERAVSLAWDTEPAPPLTAEEAGRIRSVVGPRRDALRLVRSARSKGRAQWPADSTTLPWPRDMSEVDAQREVASLVYLAALDEDDRGHSAEALEYVRDVLFISRAVDEMPSLAAHGRSSHMAESAALRLAEIACGLRIATGDHQDDARAATVAQVRALIAELLDDTPYRNGLRRAFRGDRIRLLATTRGLADGRATLNDFIGGRPSDYAADHDLGDRAARVAVEARDWFFRHGWRPMIFDDGVLVLRHATGAMWAALESADLPSAVAGRGDWPDEIQGSAWREVRHAPARMMLPCLNVTVVSHYRAAAARRLAAVALAVRWCALEHGGALPARLEDLVPRYLPLVPADPLCSGTPALRYVPGAARPVVYSVGRNGTDDGGVGHDPLSCYGGGAGCDDEVVSLRRQPRPPPGAWPRPVVPSWVYLPPPPQPTGGWDEHELN